MIENRQKIIQIGPVIEILWQIVDFCIDKGGHFVLHEKLQINI